MAIKEYEAPDILVRFDTKRCIHAAECVHGLPAVFDANRRPCGPDDVALPGEVRRRGATQRARGGGAPRVETVLDRGNGPVARYEEPGRRVTGPDS